MNILNNRYQAQLLYHPESFWQYSVKVYRPDGTVYEWLSFRRKHKAEKYAQDKIDVLNARRGRVVKEY